MTKKLVGVDRINEGPSRPRNPERSAVSCKVVDDFIKCADYRTSYGIFENDPRVVKYALTMSNIQRKKYSRYGIVPAALHHYLKSIKAIPDIHIAERDRTIDNLSDLLWKTTYHTGGDAEEAEVLRKAILKEQMPWLEKQFGSAQHLFRMAELYYTVRKKTSTCRQTRVGNEDCELRVPKKKGLSNE